MIYENQKIHSDPELGAIDMRVHHETFCEDMFDEYRRQLISYKDLERESFTEAWDASIRSGSLLKQISRALKQREEHRVKNVKEQIFFITVNPKPDTDLRHFKKIVNAFINRSFVKNCEYQFEQTGKTMEELGKHPHVHIIIDKPADMSPAQLLARALSTFKNIIGNKQSIDIKTYPKTYREEKLDYIHGRKWDKDKEEAVKLNQQWRIQNAL